MSSEGEAKEPHQGLSTAITGTLFVVSAPSGAGKTSLVQALVESDPGVEVSISHTTRPARPGEINGVNYHFVEDSEFNRLVANNGFLEHASVFGNRYGTAAEFVQRRLQQGRDVLLEIDWQGAQQVRQRVECCSIFILPPSLPALAERLAARRQDSREVIARRLSQAVADMSHHPEYDYLIVNDDFARARENLIAIVQSQRLAQPKATLRQQALLTSLLSSQP